MSEKQKILIVEDIEFNVVLLEFAFNSFNLPYAFANNGKEAVDIMRKENDIELILMDIETPVMNGIDATKIIREELPHPKRDVKIVAMTGHSEEDIDFDLTECGFNGILTKPFDTTDLEKLLEEYDITLNKSVTRKEIKPSEIKEYDLANLREWIGDDQKVIRQMVLTFIENGQSTLKQMKMSYFNKDWNKLKELAHGFSSQLNFFGRQDLVDSTNNIEKTCIADIPNDLMIGAELDYIIEQCFYLMKALERDFQIKFPIEQLHK